MVPLYDTHSIFARIFPSPMKAGYYWIKSDIPRDRNAVTTWYRLLSHPAPLVHRRDLFRLRPSGDAVRETMAVERLNGGDLILATRPAMGSHFEIRLPARTPGGLELATAGLDLIDELEAQMTVYRDDSEISRINATAHLGPVRVEPRLFELIEAAMNVTRATGGAYDVVAGALSEAWGFVRGPKRVPKSDELSEARRKSGAYHLRLDASHSTISFDRPGVVINLGSIGKGYALDRVAELVTEHWWPTPGLLHGGRSSLLAIGSPPDDFGGQWRIAVRDPFEPSRPLGVLHLRNRGLGTSGSAFQQFELGGRTYGHIIDPRSGEPPAHGPASVTVIAPSAAEADALSTACYLLGVERSREFLRSKPEVGALFVLAEQASGKTQVETINLSESDWTPRHLAVGFGLG
jgi:FAD:protein FMN transferase